MFLAGMNQLAVAGTEIVRSFVSNNQTNNNEEASPIQTNSIDSVTLSNKAVELSSETGAEVDFKEDTGTNQKQEMPSAATTLINVLA